MEKTKGICLSISYAPSFLPQSPARQIHIWAFCREGLLTEAGRTSVPENCERQRATSNSDYAWLYGYVSGIINAQSCSLLYHHLNNKTWDDQEGEQSIQTWVSTEVPRHPAALGRHQPSHGRATPRSQEGSQAWDGDPPQRWEKGERKT